MKITCKSCSEINEFDENAFDIDAKYSLLCRKCNEKMGEICLTNKKIDFAYGRTPTPPLQIVKPQLYEIWRFDGGEHYKNTKYEQQYTYLSAKTALKELEDTYTGEFYLKPVQDAR